MIKSPVSVRCWFEMGSLLRSILIPPKFMWRETYIPDIDNRKLSSSCREPMSVEILNMVRILTPTELDRTLFPYAKLDRTFTIKLVQESDLLVFEANTIVERDWFVHNLKLVVARLASMVIVGDDQMFLEFFTPWSPSPMYCDNQISSGWNNNTSVIDNTEVKKHNNKTSKETSDKGKSSEKRFYTSSNKDDVQKLWGTGFVNPKRLS
jgi:hypothetical protein